MEVREVRSDTTSATSSDGSSTGGTGTNASKHREPGGRGDEEVSVVRQPSPQRVGAELCGGCTSRCVHIHLDCLPVASLPPCRHALLLLAAALPMMLVGSWLGARVVRRFNPLWFSRAVGAVLLVSGTALIFK